MSHGGKKDLKSATRDLAKFAEGLARETQQELNKIHQILGQTNEVMAALVRVVGQELVEQTIKETRAEQQAVQLEQQVAGVKRAVDDKILVPAEVLGSPETSFLVGTEKSPDGTERRVQFELSAVNPEFLNLYVGKKAGDTLDVNGSTLTITEVYSIDRAHAEEVMKAAQNVPVPAPEVAPNLVEEKAADPVVAPDAATDTTKAE